MNPLVLRVSSRERAEISGAAYAGNCSCLRAVFSAFMHFEKVNYQPEKEETIHGHQSGGDINYC